MQFVVSPDRVEEILLHCGVAEGDSGGAVVGDDQISSFEEFKHQVLFEFEVFNLAAGLFGADKIHNIAVQNELGNGFGEVFLGKGGYPFWSL